MVVTSKSYIFVITVRSYNMPERTGALKALSVLSLCSENPINGCLIFWFTDDETFLKYFGNIVKESLHGEFCRYRF